MAHRIDVRKLGPIPPYAWAVGSWREDAEVQPDPAPEVQADRLTWHDIANGVRVSPRYLDAMRATDELDAIDQPY